MRTLIPAAIWLGTTACAGESTSKSTETIFGTWQVETAVSGGAEMPPAVTDTMSLTLTETTYEALVAGQSDKGLIVIDNTFMPYRIDIAGTDGPNAGSEMKSIYKLDGDSLIISYDVTGAAYPTSFESVPGQADFVITYKRK